jgi:hypothetical protein
MSASAGITRPMRNGMAAFFGLLFLLMLLKFGISFIPVEPGSSAATAWSYAFTPFVIALPVYAIFCAAKHDWSWQLATQFIVLGVLIHVPLAILEKGVSDPILLAALSAFGQTGLLLWTTGLGALLALRVKDKNILIPVSIFVASFDIFLVFTPDSPMQKIIAKVPGYLPSVGYRLPTAGSVEPFAFIGPADFLFMGLFFVAITRFEMDSKNTVKWMIVAILVYLCISMFGIHQLPLMVPIGLTVLFVNWKYFKLNKEEIMSTIIIGVICISLISWAAFRKARQSGISIEARDSAPEGSETKPAPGQPDQPPSGSLNAPTSTPNPQ